MKQLERKDIYILNREAIQNLVDTQNGRNKKTLVCEAISEKTGLDFNVLYNKVGICNPKTRMVPSFVAHGMIYDGFSDFSDFILDVRRVLILMNATGETLFGTNEKIALTIMLLFYEEKEWWTPNEIVEKARAAGVADKVLTRTAIETVLNNNKSDSRHHILFKKDGDNFCLDVAKIIQHINTDKSVNHKVSTILT